MLLSQGHARASVFVVVSALKACYGMLGMSVSSKTSVQVRRADTTALCELSLQLFFYPSVVPTTHQQCPEGEVFNECGTACPLTCDAPHMMPCTRQCVRGCICPKNMLRNSTNQCVSLNQCPGTVQLNLDVFWLKI